MGRKLIGILTGIGCLGAAAAVALYLNMWFQEAREQQEYLRRLQAQVLELNEESLEKNRNLARWYNYSLENGMQKPDAYPSILSFGGDIGWLTLPGEQVIPIHHGGKDDSWGAVHDPESDFPLGTAGECTVLRLVQPPGRAMEQGNIVTVNCLNESLLYRVEKIRERLNGDKYLTEEAGLTLLVAEKNSLRAVWCSRISQWEEPEKQEDPEQSAVEPAMAAVGAVTLPAAVWGLGESVRKQSRMSKKLGKIDKKARKNGKTINKSEVSRK